MKKSTLFLSVICLLQFAMLFAQPGSLDITFSTDGKVTTAIGNATDYGQSVVLQSDGKIVVAGYSDNGPNDDFALARYTTTGSLDNTFDTDGIVTTAIGSSTDRGHSVVLQSDGKIVVAGWSDNGADDDFALVRYTTTGSLDNTFGTGGIVTTAIGSSNDYGLSVAIQSDGKIVVAGYSSNGANFDFALARYTTTGSLDNTFDTDGKVTTAIGSADDRGYSVVLQSDGKIVVAGSSYKGTNDDFAIARYTTTGSLDNTFDTDGKLTTAIGSSADVGNSVALQSDGKIVVAGYSYNGANTDFALVRYTTTGSLDNTFDTDGKVTTAIGSSHDYGYSVALQSDGKIVVAGHSSNGSNFDFALARYTTTGSMDNTFDTDGKVTTAIGSANDYGNSVALQSDGKIVVAGYSSTGANYDFSLVRYNNTVSSSISSQNILCNGQCTGTATVTATIGSSPYTYSWSNGKTTQTVTGLCAGTYTVIVTDSVSATTKITVTITQPSVLTLTVTANASTTFCQGNSLVLTALASASVMYQWSTGSTMQNITVNQSGSYTVTVTNSCGSAGSPATVVIVNPLPSVTANASANNVCAGTTVILSGGGAISYSWTGGATNGVGFAPSITKTYTVTGTDGNNCTGKAKITVTVNPLLLTTMNTVICSGNIYTLPGGMQVNIGGIYRDTLSTAMSCDSIIVTNLTVYSVNTAINNSANVITASATGAAYQWLNCNTGNSAISGATAKSYTATVNGSYAVKVTQSGCSDTSTCVNVNSLGISQPVLSEVEGGVRLFPNPFSNILTIDPGNNISVLIVDIMDLQGRTVISQTIEQGKADINTENLAKGIYVVQIMDSDNSASHFKMIKE